MKKFTVRNYNTAKENINDSENSFELVLKIKNNERFMLFKGT